MTIKTLDQNIKLYARTINIEIGTPTYILVKLFDDSFDPKKDPLKQKALAQKEYNDVVVQKDSGLTGKIEKKFTIRKLAQELGVDPEKVKYVGGWIDIVETEEEITREYEKEVLLKVEKQKKKLHFIFYTLTGSKNDSIFIDQVNLREKTIENTKEYNDKIDIIYIKEVKKSSEILSYVKNKIEENGGQEEIEVKTVDLFAELFKEKKKQEKDKSSVDTGGHWLDRMAQPYIPDGVSVDEARNVINDNVKRKEYLNKVYEANQEEFIEELRAGTIREIEHIETFSIVASATTAGKTLPQIPIFFAITGLIAHGILHIVKETSTKIFLTKLTFDTTMDIIAGSDKRLAIANELFIKPYFSFIVDNINNLEENKIE